LQTTTNLQARGGGAAGRARPLSGFDLMRRREPAPGSAKKPGAASRRKSGLPDLRNKKTDLGQAQDRRATFEFQLPNYIESPFKSRALFCSSSKRRELHVLRANTEHELDLVFANLAEARQYRQSIVVSLGPAVFGLAN
jgi:hypothetical protein